MTPENDPNVIETEFSASWDRMEQYFNGVRAYNPRYEVVKLMVDLIADLRQRGYDRQFRAGQQLFVFVISRSRNYGLRCGQPRIQINLNTKGGITVRYYKPPDEDIEFDVDRVEVTPEVEALLQRLLAHPID